VAHTCNPSYPGGRDQEDGDLRPTQTNSLRDPISKTPNPTHTHTYTHTHTHRTGRVAQVVEHLPSKREAPSLNPNTAQKKKKRLTITTTNCTVQSQVTHCMVTELPCSYNGAEKLLLPRIHFYYTFSIYSQTYLDTQVLWYSV
jgi:hypothetical protein